MERGNTITEGRQEREGQTRRGTKPEEEALENESWRNEGTGRKEREKGEYSYKAARKGGMLNLAQ